MPKGEHDAVARAARRAAAGAVARVLCRRDALSFSGVLNALLVEHGYSIRLAGSFTGVASALSLLGLPALTALSARTGIRPLLVAVSLLASLAFALLLGAQLGGGADALWEGGIQRTAHVAPWLWWSPRVALAAHAHP